LRERRGALGAFDAAVLKKREAQMQRKTRVSHLIVACAAALALCGLMAPAATAGPAPQTEPGDLLDPRTYAPDSKLFLVVHAIGVQKYTCQASGTWLFTDPEATLYKTTGVPKPIGTHFFNFATSRPVWQLKDGSSVEARAFASMSGGPGNIAWLLLQAVVTTAGPDGDRLTSTTWVQRLNTSGGVAPAETCSPGDRIRVPYSTDYFFWRAAGGD
jgi:hypothetical protein